MNRLFTFGCSFTNYKWPTWADILGSEFDQFENWGKSGAGNLFIFNSLIECSARNHLNSQDTVIVMCTNITREDRYVKNEWITPGNIYTQNIYDDAFVKKFADVRGYAIRDFALIHSARTQLKHLGVKYIFLSMVDMTSFDQYKVNKIANCDDIFDLYKESIIEIRPSVHEVVFNHDWWSRPFFNEKFYNIYAGADWPSYDEFKLNNFSSVPKHIIKEISKLGVTRVDTHATPIEYLEYINKVLPEYTISNKIKTWISEIDNRIRNEEDYKDIYTENKPKRF